VRLTAEARDTEVPWTARDDEIQAALGRTPVAPYTEIWSLVRRAGAQTKPQGFAVGRACPGCGAPLDQGEVIKCRYCGALVCSGEHDWVLAEITQLEEWRPREGSPAGVDALRARDPGVAAEVLEDRASYLFWKWVEAARAGSAVPLRKAATPAFIGSGGRAEWARGASDVAVGGADVVRCTVAGATPARDAATPARDATDGYDHVDVLVRWSARFGGSREYTPSQCVIRMARRAGVQSRPSMTALVCQACGAPVSDSDSTRCQACGAELAAGDQAWVLEAVLTPSEAGV
jgi:DNA-directed RNA polymerase subunit RPC12/RpoP